MRVKRTIHRFTTNIVYPFNSIPPPAGSTPTQILYLNVLYQIFDDYLSPDYQYGDESGTYAIGSGGISAFLDDVRNNQVATNNNRTAKIPVGGVPILGSPSYVVIAIDPAGRAEFSIGDKVKTDDNKDDYFNLILVPDFPDDPSPPYHIAYFRAKSPAQTYVLDPAHYKYDSFNLYLDFLTATGGSSSGVIDPDIRNTGGSSKPKSKSRKKRVRGSREVEL